MKAILFEHYGSPDLLSLQEVAQPLPAANEVLIRVEATAHLFLPGALLLLSTAICAYFYLFEQNWFYTILYNDYTGFAYLAHLLLVFAALCDIVFNRARVTTEIINALGNAFSVAPC